MRVLFVSYDHPFRGRSGVSAYARDLLPALVGRGIGVGALFVDRRTWRRDPHLRTAAERDVTLFSLVNSPIHPEDSLHRPEQDVRNEAVEALFRECLADYRPDLVHVQTFQGFPGSLLAVAQAMGVPSLVMLHDFWSICPRIGLVRAGGAVCDGPDGGRNCVRFCVQPRPVRQRIYQLGIRLPDGRIRKAFLAARGLYQRSWGKGGSLWAPAGRRDRATAPDGDDALVARHGRRPAAMLRILDSADLIVAVSEFVKSVFVRHGIGADRIHTLTPALDVHRHLVWRARPAPEPPIRFGFLGRAVPMKGAHVFAEAAGGIPTGRARFLLFGGASPQTERFLNGLAGDNRLEFRGVYGRDQLAQVLDDVDVVVVPSVVQETVGLVPYEAQAAGVPIIASRIGAIPECVRDGETGLLCIPGNPDDLREKMLRMVENPALAAALSARTRPPMSLSAHVDRLIELYAACRRRRAGT